MNGKNAKFIAIAGGVATIVAAVTKAEQGREWRDIHKIAVVAGTVLAIAGMVT